MRLSKTLTAGAALIALASLTACGGDGDGGGQLDAGFGSKPSGPSQPKAKNVAEMERFVNQYTVCKDLETEATAGGTAREAFAKLPQGSAGGVKEQAFCEAERGQPIVLLAVSDMKKFTAGLKAVEDAGKDGVALVGVDFAVVPDDGKTVAALKSSGLLITSCKADFNSKIPSGYIKRESKVPGCLVTDYFPV